MLGEETRLQQRLLKSGAKGVYLPEAVVWHYVPAERCSENWALERQFRRGLSNAARLGTSVVNGRRLLKVPLWIWKEYFIELLGYLKAMLAGSSKSDRFSKKVTWWRTKGMVSYFMKQS
jgi:GT2 family glycosyltransferase